MSQATPPQSLEFDLLTLEGAQDAHPLYHRLRAGQPIHWSSQLQGWFLTRHADISTALRDDRLVAGPMMVQFDRLPEEAREQLLPLRDAVNMWMGHTTHEGHVRFKSNPSPTRCLTPPGARAPWSWCRSSPFRFETLLRRFPHVRPAKGTQPTWEPRIPLNRELRALPVEL